jgi:hypothetical protein
VPGIDDNIRSELERLGRPADPEGALEEIGRRRSRRAVVRRVQIGALAVAVVAGSVGGTFGLVALFRADRGPRTPGDGVPVATASSSVAHEPTGSPTESPSPSPTPTESSSPEPSPSATPTGEAPFIGYACGSSEINADFDGDGRLDAAMVHWSDIVLDHPPPCPSLAPGDTADWRIDVEWGNGVTGAWPLPECDWTCRAYSSYDLDGNGTSEFALVVHGGASTDFLNFFELPAEEPGPILFAEASQSTPLELAAGGSVTHMDFVTCQTDGSGGPQLVSTAAALSQDGSTWNLTETVYAFDPSAPAGGDPRTADAFSVASTNTSTQPADPNGDPPTVNGSPCFVPEGS